MPSCSCAWLCPALESLLFRADFIYVTLHLIFILTSFRILPIGIWFGSSDSIPRVWLAPGRASDSTELLAPVDHLRFNIQWTIVLWSFFLYPAILSDNLPVRCHVQKNGQQERQSRGWPRWLRRLVKNDRTIVGIALINSLMGVTTISSYIYQTYQHSTNGNDW